MPIATTYGYGTYGYGHYGYGESASPPAGAPASGLWGPIILFDPDTLEAVGEVADLRADRSYSYRHNRITTSHFTMALEDPLGDRVLETDLLAASWRGEYVAGEIVYPEKPAFVGEITDVEEVVDETGRRIGVTAGDASFILGQRLIGKSVAGYSKTVPALRRTILTELLDELNAGGDTGLRMGTLEDLGTVTVGPWNYKPAAEVLAELAAPLDGCDWRVEPVLPTADATGVYWGRLNLYYAKGIARPDAIFSFTDDPEDLGNVRGYNRTRTKQGMATDAYSLPPGFPETTELVKAWQDLPARAKWRRREAVIAGDLGVAELRLALAQQTVAVRANPRETITFGAILPSEIAQAAQAGEPIPDVPVFGVDYDVGDVVRFRATVGGDERLDVLVRVWGVDLSIDDAGVETPILATTPDS